MSCLSGLAEKNAFRCLLKMSNPASKGSYFPLSSSLASDSATSSCKITNNEVLSFFALDVIFTIRTIRLVRPWMVFGYFCGHFVFWAAVAAGIVRRVRIIPLHLGKINFNHSFGILFWKPRVHKNRCMHLNHNLLKLETILIAFHNVQFTIIESFTCSKISVLLLLHHCFDVEICDSVKWRHRRGAKIWDQKLDGPEVPEPSRSLVRNDAVQSIIIKVFSRVLHA